MRGICEKWLSPRRDRQNASHVVPDVADLRQGRSNTWEDVREPLIADERWGVLLLVTDPHLQPLEYMEVPMWQLPPPPPPCASEGTASGCTCPGGGGNPSVLDANYPPPPKLAFDRRPFGGGIGAGGFREGQLGGV